MTFFRGIAVAPPIESYYMNKLFLDEEDPNKVNLTVGAYKTEEGEPWVFPVVREAERRLAADNNLNHEYLPVLGYEPFCKAATALVLGADNKALLEGRAFGIQCLSGTGSLRIGAEFLASILKLTTVYVSNPTWGNHKLVFKTAGFTSINEYKYYDTVKNRVDMDQFLMDLLAAPEKSVIILHVCAHNPTGMDPSREEWIQIAQIIKERNLFTFFDTAYQGFATGDPDADTWPIRYFIDQGLECFIAQSFAKNFDERIGNLTVVLNDSRDIEGIRSQMTLIIRANWSNPPSHGARVVEMILSDPQLRQEWLETIKIIYERVKKMRAALRSHLDALGTPGNWEHITKQIGFFSYTGLTAEQADHLHKKHKVFLLKDGRVNICGLNAKNVEYTARAIDETVRNVKT